ncbi:MAG TPA: PASTA domain-containing protein [Thermoanaerobaculia bacterium]
MLPRLLRGCGLMAYGLFIVVLFVLAAYISFSAFVRSGVTKVPNVVGMPRAEAASALADQGLELETAKGGGRYDEKVPAGRIARQNPDPTTFVKRGRPVVVVLSLGPRRVQVPDLTGKNLPAAQAAASGQGLGIGNILGAFAPNREPAGTVLVQDPEPGASVPPATGVNVTLAMAAQGERYIMPDLVYRDYEAVRPYFEQVGFKLGNVKFERYEGVAAGVILRQFPLPGHPVTRDDAISLVVATAEGLPGVPADPGAPPASPPAAAPGAPGTGGQ